MLTVSVQESGKPAAGEVIVDYVEGD